MREYVKTAFLILMIDKVKFYFFEIKIFIQIKKLVFYII